MGVEPRLVRLCQRAAELRSACLVALGVGKQHVTDDARVPFRWRDHADQQHVGVVACERGDTGFECLRVGQTSLKTTTSERDRMRSAYASSADSKSAVPPGVISSTGR